VAIVPISDRRARLALILALLGVPSIGVTLPAALWLGVGAVRQRYLVSGAEPVTGFLALVIGGIDLLFIDQGLRRWFEVTPPETAWPGIGLGVLLAAAVVLFVASSLRIHPERSGAVLAARAGLVASFGGGTAMFVRLLGAIQT
jgi:hypothetical protein